MAIIQYGSLVTGLVGKLGGHVFQKCGQSNSIHNLNVPRKFASNAQGLSRMQFAYLCSKWSSLSTSAQTSFATKSPQYPAFDRFGNPIVLTGFQLFINLNRYLLLGGLTLCLEAGNYVAPYNAQPYFYDMNLGASSWPVSLNATLPAYTHLLLYLSRYFPSSAERSYPPFVYIGRLPAGSTHLTNCYSLIPSSWQRPAADNYLAYGAFVAVDSSTGCHSSRFFNSFLIST